MNGGDDEMGEEGKHGRSEAATIMPASACSLGGPERALSGNLPLLTYGPPYC